MKSSTFPSSYVTPACFPAEDELVQGINQAFLGKEAGLPVTPGALIDSPHSHQVFMVYFLKTSDSELSITYCNRGPITLHIKETKCYIPQSPLKEPQVQGSS